MQWPWNGSDYVDGQRNDSLFDRSEGGREKYVCISGGKAKAVECGETESLSIDGLCNECREWTAGKNRTECRLSEI